ncbi:hypothetical protein NVP1115B_63 [Vibrio phage 1.115.B._10N.222.49.B11]|nr:hypothetical protein NVP1115A_63 [Vibrio phage 1.115.A._10N.222.49.B11]AUR88609.1 hypothetical protein NVP1115B_63 [Vibrio phage 1.115.B._10N.222.49.B11]
MTEQEKIVLAYWYTELCTNIELALKLSPKPNTAARGAAKSIIKRTPCRTIKLMAKKVSKMPLPSTWIKKQHKLITNGGMTVDDYYRQGVACGKLMESD